MFFLFAAGRIVFLFIFIGVCIGALVFCLCGLPLNGQSWDSRYFLPAHVRKAPYSNRVDDYTLSRVHQATLFIHNEDRRICTAFVDLNSSGKELLHQLHLDKNVPSSSRLTWCRKNLLSDISLLEYSMRNLNTIFLGNGGLKGGNSDSDGDRDEDHRVTMMMINDIKNASTHTYKNAVFFI